MITGAHSILYSTTPDADRAFLRDVLGLPHVDVGDGWLIFGLPPSEVAVHPAEANGRHEMYFLCEDVAAFTAEMEKRGIACGPIADRGWGLLTELELPGGGKIGVYEPRHARPTPVAARSATRRKKAKKAKKAKKKTRPARRPGRRR
jgi:hypothetical protein